MSASRAETLKYKVEYVSSEDDSYKRSAQELDASYINGKGWISSKYCHFPQEMVFKLKKRSNIEKIQVLCHHAFIPERVEVYIGNISVGDRVSLSKAKFEKLGFVTFQDNRSSNYEARELKSIYVDANGWFVRFLVFDNHKNSINNYQQVGIMSITVNGYPLGDPKEEGDSPDEEEDYKAMIRKERARLNMDHDRRSSAAPSSAVNPAPKQAPNPIAEEPEPILNSKDYVAEMKKVQKMLENKKKEAVAGEKFEHAKKLKNATDKLTEVQGEMGKLTREKEQAVKEEDYDHAQECNSEIETLRKKTYDEIDLYHLLNHAERTQLGLEQPTTAPYSYSKNPNPYSRDEVVLPTIKQKDSVRASPDVAEQKEPDKLPPINQSRPNSSSWKETAENVENTGGILNKTADDTSVPCEFSDKDRQSFQFAMGTFGEKLVMDACCKNWKHRVQGLNALELHLEEGTFEQKQQAIDILTPAIQLLKRGLHDKVYQVFKAALLLLEFILTKYINRHGIAKAASTLVAEKTWYSLVQRTGDTVTDSRFKPTTQAFILELARAQDDNVRQAYVSRILRPFQASGYPKIDEGHAELAEKIVKEHHPNTGVTTDKAAQFSVSCLLHTAGAVREIGIRILVWLYRKGEKEKVRSYLPPDNARTRQRHPLYKRIFEEFDKIDGRTPGKKGAAKDVNEDQIEALRRQNAEIRKALEDRSRGGQQASQPRKQSLANPPVSRRRSSVVAVADPAAEQVLNNRGQSRAGDRSPRPAPPSDDIMDKTCVFCTEQNDEFDPETLDVHYLKYCPMLAKCPHCKKVVEISGLKDHFTTECSAKNKFKQCQRCKEPLEEADWNRHNKNKDCEPAKPPSEAERCLLCHKDVAPNNDDGWRKHLIGPDACRGNPRRTNGIGGPRDEDEPIPSPSPVSFIEPSARSARPKPGKEVGTVKRPPQPQTPTPQLSVSAVDKADDNLCVFCGEKSDKFNSETLEAHYMTNCPMLILCPHCRKVIEISSLKEHFTSECIAKDRYKTCQRCKEPLEDAEWKRHKKDWNCKPAQHYMLAERCLLCHEDVEPPTDEAWRSHLIGQDACRGNSRRGNSTTQPRGKATQMPRTLPDEDNDESSTGW